VGPAETRAEAGELPRDIAPLVPPADVAAISPSATSRPTPVLANLWQLHETYILAPVSGGLVIIDQHAAHERVLYEEAIDRMRGASGTSQLFLIPLLVDLTRAEFELVLELMEPLSRLGFDIAPISPPSVLVRGAPSGLAGRDPGQLLRDLLDGVGEDRGRPLPDDELADRLAKSYACHAAVRAGEPLTIEEMNRLVDKLFATSLPHGDPHGRPSCGSTLRAGPALRRSCPGATRTVSARRRGHRMRPFLALISCHGDRKDGGLAGLAKTTPGTGSFVAIRARNLPQARPGPAMRQRPARERSHHLFDGPKSVR
jgi:hypothetical protein